MLDFLCNELAGTDLKVDLVYFGEDKEENQEILSFARGKLEEKSFLVDSKVISGDTDKSLPGYLEKNTHDVLAMGAFGHGVLHDFFVGSLISKMIQKSKVPILLIK